jgi:hypothetical protein
MSMSDSSMSLITNAVMEKKDRHGLVEVYELALELRPYIDDMTVAEIVVAVEASVIRFNGNAFWSTQSPLRAVRREHEGFQRLEVRAA